MTRTNGKVKTRTPRLAKLPVQIAPEDVALLQGRHQAMQIANALAASAQEAYRVAAEQIQRTYRLPTRYQLDFQTGLVSRVDA